MKVGYCRVSSEDQSLDIQIEQLTVAGCEKLFAEKKSGTTTNDRAELENAISFVREGDVFVVTRLDRMARSLPDLLTIVERLRAKGVELKVTEQPVDTTSPAGMAFLQMLGVFAQFETSLRRERQNEGIAKAKAAGKYKGGKPKIDVATVERLREDGLGATAIAKRLGIARASVYRLVPMGWGPSPIER